MFKNRKEIYSIRRYAIGTASVVLGALIFLGHPTAHAEEETQSTQTKPENKDNVPPSEAENDTQSVPADQAAQNAQNDGKVTTNEETSSNTVTQDKETPIPENDVDTSEEENDTTDGDNESTETPEQPQENKDVEQTQPSKDDSVDEPTTDDKNETQPLKDEEKIDDSKDTNVSHTIDNTPQQNAPAQAQPTPDTTLPQSEQPSTTPSPEKDPSENIIRVNNQTDEQPTVPVPGSEDDDETTIDKALDNVAVVPHTSLRKASDADNDTGATGSNVNDSVKFTNLSILTDNGKTVQPINNESFLVRGQFKVDAKVMGGDYFTVQLPDTAVIDDLNHDNEGVDPIVDGNGNVIADGKYDKTKKQFTYTFTKYVDDKTNLRGSLNYRNYIDRNEVRNDQDNVELTYDFAGDKVTENVDVRYNNYIVEGNVNMGSAFTHTNLQTREYEQVIYVNPLSKNIREGLVDVYGYYKEPSDSSGKVNDNTEFKIYKVKKNTNLNGSYFFDETDDIYEDVTKNFDINIDSSKNIAHIDFGTFDTPYIIRVKSQADKNSDAEITQSATLTDSKGDQVFVNNYITVTHNSADGEGDQAPTHKLGNFVWEDTNRNGIQDNGEKGIPGVNVMLTSPNGEFTVVRTNDEGYYEFKDLYDGVFQVEFEPPEGYIATVEEAEDGTDENDSNGLTTTVEINGEDNMSVDSGFYKEMKLTIGDRVWEDTNKDGIQDDGEPGIKDVEVTLLNDKGVEINKTTTDEKGNYSFTDLDSGTYTVNFATPDGYLATKENAGADKEKDSEGKSVTVTLTDKDDLTVDSGFYLSLIHI